MQDNVTIDLHDGQRRIIDERKRFNVICCGRRWGKSRLAFALALETIAQRCFTLPFFRSS